MSDDTVYVATVGGGANRNRVHLDEDCAWLQRAGTHHERDRRPWHDDRICSYCSGEADVSGAAPGVDSQATRRTLLEADPDEVGRS